MTPVGFAIKFLLAFGILMACFEASRGSAFERFLIEDAILAPTVALINETGPEHVTLVDRTITSPGSRLRVTRGCEGVEMFLMLIAGIIAFPANLQRRLQGLVIGSALAYVLTVGRLVTLHCILRYAPGAWDALHGLVLPLGPIIVLALYFMRWTTAASVDRAPLAT